MFCIGICDDDEGLCGELEKMLYDYGKENKLQMNIDIWYQGESLCRFLRENKKILDVLFLDIELLTTNGIEVGRFIREEQENGPADCSHGIRCKVSYVWAWGASFFIIPLYL